MVGEEDYSEFLRESNDYSDIEAQLSKWFEEDEGDLESKESKSTSNQLRDYRIFIESGVFRESCQSYFELMKRFVNEEIGGKDFESQFLRLRGQDIVRSNELCEKIQV